MQVLALLDRCHSLRLHTPQLKNNNNNDIEIDLKSDKMSKFESLYSMSQEELQVLHEYLDEQLTKEFIQSSCFSFVSFMLFVKKSEEELHFCIDYSALNAIMI